MPSRVYRISPDEARRLFEKNRDILLLDVRQPEEYKNGHIPGAVLLPLPELPDRLGELNVRNGIITYCRLGRRSLAAAQLIADERDAEVYTIDGGIMAWNGFVAKGEVEAEQGHKNRISESWPDIKLDDRFKGYMESGILIADSIEKVKNRDLMDAIEYSMQAEINSLDLYMKISRIADDNIKGLFRDIIEEEKLHLKRLGALLSEHEG
ncbi:sulfurtransferase [Dissulfurispira thermophila]|uniref:Sulfurtransferase n=1 Tax=Dissulfurispira thermophila TaxID=2715679 RepID=A0A7G1H0G9_9BACT|nr:rhodanese-like domain-containing protein [Dissulfurispira thermophila]BCB95591.1 sulfurtransferase [Dissulfurispira thermophila]